TLRDDVLAAGFEFVGTTFWLLLGLGGIQTAYNLSAGDKISIGHNFYVAASMGLSLMAQRIFSSVLQAIGPVRFVLYSIAQFLGAIAAAGLAMACFQGALDVENHAHDSNHGSSSFSTPVAVGMTMFAVPSVSFAYLYTGASMNVARAFGPGVVNRFSRNYHGHHWIYWVAALYTIMKLGRYWKLSPDHSVNDQSDSPPGAVNGMKNMVTGGNPNAVDGTTARDGHHGLFTTTVVGGGVANDGYTRPAVV
ncbi:aquaporin-like protein, partial [Coprinopsis sp. MPI-PUGE-AT-0042]